MNAPTGPLSGLHVLDLSSFVAGPSCTMTLAQLGADVLRIDPLAGAPDAGRHPVTADGTSLYWAGLNKGKRVARADLRSEDGRSLVRRLLAVPGAGHGILVTNAVGQAWLDYEELRSVRPDLVMIRLEGRSDGGSAVDYTINCETGLPGITGPEGLGTPVNSVLPSWDLLAGLHAVVALLAACRRREESGEGALIRLSLADVAAATLGHLGYIADAVVNGTERHADGNALYGTYGQDFVLSDGRRIMLVGLTARHWRVLVESAGIAAEIAELQAGTGADLAEEGARYEHRERITALLAPWFAARSLAEAATALDAALIPWGEYRTVREMASAPDGLVARSTIFDELDGYPVPRSVARSTGWASPPTPAPLAADPAAVLAEWAAPLAARGAD